MILSFGRPDDLVATIDTIEGGDAAFVAGDDGHHLFDGRPGSVSAFLWSSGEQTIESKVALSIATEKGFARGFGLVGLIGTNLPVGTRIRVRIYGLFIDVAEDYVELGSGVVTELPHGERVCWMLLNDDAETKAPPQNFRASETPFYFWIEIFNDVDGSTAIEAGAEIRIGEIWVGTVEDFQNTGDWRIEYADSDVADSDAKQPFAKRGVPRRTLTFTPANRGEASIFGSESAPEALDFEKLMAQIDRSAQAVYIPRWHTADGAYSHYLTCRTAIFGTATKAASAKHLSGPWFGSGEMVVREAPVPT